MLVFCLFIPFPHGYTVSRGVPVRLLRMTQKTFPIKRREFVKIYTRRIRKFDEFLGFLTGSENPSVRVANLTFDQTNSFHSFVCLLLVCSFSPKVQKYLLGSPFPINWREFEKIYTRKRWKFDEFLGFFASSHEGAYASQISLLTKQTLFIHLFVFCSFAPSPQKYKSIFWGPLFHDFSGSGKTPKSR